jgi:hypothetical protein
VNYQQHQNEIITKSCREHYHKKNKNPYYIRNNALRAPSPALRAMDDDRATVTVPVAVADVAFAITVVAPAAALTLFAAAVTRK